MQIEISKDILKDQIVKLQKALDQIMNHNKVDEAIQYKHNRYTIFARKTTSASFACSRCKQESSAYSTLYAFSSPSTQEEILEAHRMAGTVERKEFICNACFEALSIMPDIEFYNKITEGL